VAFSVFVYTVLGFSAASPQASAPHRSGHGSRASAFTSRPFMAAFLGVLTLAYVGIPINDRLLPGILAMKSMIGNAILLVACTALGVPSTWASGPSRAVGARLRRDGVLREHLSRGRLSTSTATSMSGLSHRLGAYAGLVVGCTILFLLVPPAAAKRRHEDDLQADDDDAAGIAAATALCSARSQAQDAQHQACSAGTGGARGR
jgi:hypothetical protein